MSSIIFIFVLFVLVLVHELGHFFAAKKTGMRVDEFGIGFPPRLFGIQRGETVYSVNAIPLGGFVKILGEDGDQALSEADKPRAFSSRPFWAQALVLVAGVSMNVLFAWVLFAMAFMIGTKSSVEEGVASPAAQLTVVSLLPESPAQKAGLSPGDVITKVVNENGHVLETLRPSMVSEFIHDNGTVQVTFMRGDHVETKSLSTQAGLLPNEPGKKVVGMTMGLMEETRKSFGAALKDAGIYTLSSLSSITVGLMHFVYDAFHFRADFSSVAGPVGIAGMVGDAASLGVSALLVFAAFISLNLAVINILPFPALDGGRLLLVLVEVVKGSPVPVRVAQTLNGVGFLLLIGLMIVVTFHDVVKLF